LDVVFRLSLKKILDFGMDQEPKGGQAV